MANNVFQVKRTTVSGRTPNTTGSYATNSQYIAAGEFALNMADGILYSSNGSAVIEIGSNNTNQRITNALTIDNNKALRFTTVNTSAYVNFIQQSDDNFVMYSTNTSYGQRAIWSVFANSDSSEFSFSAPVRFNANITALTANGTTGSAGQILATNGSAVYWVTPGAASVNTAAQFNWTNIHTFSANVSFTGNGIGIASNTGAIYFGGLADANWRIGRNTGAATKWVYTNNSIDIITANSSLEGMSIGLIGGNSYFETGYLGTYIASNVTIGNSSVNSFINSTSAYFGNSTVNTTIISANININSGTVTVNAPAVNINQTWNNASATFTGIRYNATSTAGGVNSTLIDLYRDNIRQFSVNRNGTVYAGGGIISDPTYNWYNGNTTSYANVSYTAYFVGNSTVNAIVNATAFTIGNSSVNASANSSSFNVVGNTTTLPTVGLTATGLTIGNSTTTTTTAITLSVANSITNSQLTQSSFRIGNATINSTANSSSFNVVGNTTTLPTVGLSSTGLTIGNSTTTTTTAITLSVANSITNSQLTQSSFRIGNATINSTANSSTFVVTGNTTTLATATVSSSGLTVGNSSVTATALSISVSNSISNAQITPIVVSVANTTTNTQLSQGSLFVGNTTVNSLANSSSFSIVGNTTTLATVSVTGTGLVAGNSTITNTSMVISVANSVGNVQLTPISMAVANTTVSAFIANTTQVTIAAGVPLSANGGTGTAGQVLTSNGATGSPYWSTVTSGGVNTAASYTWTNVQIFTANVTVNGAIIAGGNSGTAGQLLASNGTGNVYWTDVPVTNAVYMKGGAATIGTLAAGGTNIFRVNANTLNYNTTIATGENAQATGPLSVASGITLTVESGARVAIL